MWDEKWKCPDCGYHNDPDFSACVRTDGSVFTCSRKRPDVMDVKPPAPDPVSAPSHYTQGGIECVDAIRSMLGPEGTPDWLRGTVIKYLWRAPHKGSELQDYKKAAVYLKWLIEGMEGK